MVTVGKPTRGALEDDGTKVDVTSGVYEMGVRLKSLAEYVVRNGTKKWIAE